MTDSARGDGGSKNSNCGNSIEPVCITTANLKRVRVVMITSSGSNNISSNYKSSQFDHTLNEF